MASNISPRKRSKNRKKITDFFPPSPTISEAVAGEEDKSADDVPTKKELADVKLEEVKTPVKLVVTEQSVKTSSTEVEQAKLDTPAAVTKGKKGRRRGGRRKKPLSTEEQPAELVVKSEVKQTATRKKKDLDSHKLTEYFPVRRSDRRCKTDIEKQNKLDIEDAILQGKEEGLKVIEFPQKGRGVVADKDFKRGDFVVEYAGDLIDLNVAKDREVEYGKNSDIGCYMYYFKHKNQNYCVDATKESGRLGRLINHSSKMGNCMTRVVAIGERPYLILVAARNITKGEELLYDYGDRNKDSLQSHPWLAS
ncbi:N-lysine methyltransferase KMT5A-like [Tubulanus polymorphus]|uniref:N-lysine methyltransferase KMT5A-like n=1 Tax=Tubulanus polymorphus TaxID=672921 RepID=UPI003DA38D8B